ncbi:MAG: deoxyribodipyrimidine photo-lyase [Anaerolineae bacterium]|nr:DNA photolyase family protein [Thermoflexales bacterium]MDW8407025.1 deoxyribodipyrimidine photo-lyase [Anaerolineae bacterium]
MTIVIHWFRRDLRLQDNTALSAAARDAGGAVIPVFVLDNDLLRGADIAPARVHFMLDCLRELDATLRRHGSRLIVLRGNPAVELVRLVQRTGAEAVYFNRDYTPTALRRDARVTQTLQQAGVDVQTFKDSVIFEPSELRTGDGQPYTVFTPYKRAWLNRLSLGGRADAQPIDAPRLSALPPSWADIGLSALPTASELGFHVEQELPAGGESEGLRRLSHFKNSGALQAYAAQRDFPAIEGTSRLSPYLRFGAISPRQCFATAVSTLQREFPSKHSFSPAASDTKKEGADAWISELIWREFYAQILYHFPHANTGNYRREYDGLEWGSGNPTLDEIRFNAWRDGRTGYPIVDAAMRQLRQTGWMHNRARMIVASFLTKDLLLDWRLGERHFMQQLVDGDPASNNGGWQWAAGTGTDAQPYFRIFNPRLQSERFDPEGAFIRRWLPELERVPLEYLHAPHTMPALVQAQSGCTIGSDYPAPIVDHAVQKEESIRRFSEIAKKAKPSTR